MALYESDAGFPGREGRLERHNELAHSTQGICIEPIEFIETAPGVCCCDTAERPRDRTHIERLVAVNYEHHPPEGGTECLDALRLAGTRRSEGTPSKSQL